MTRSECGSTGNRRQKPIRIESTVVGAGRRCTRTPWLQRWDTALFVLARPESGFCNLVCFRLAGSASTWVVSILTRTWGGLLTLPSYCLTALAHAGFYARAGNGYFIPLRCVLYVLCRQHLQQEGLLQGRSPCQRTAFSSCIVFWICSRRALYMPARLRRLGNECSAGCAPLCCALRCVHFMLPL